MTQRCIRSAHSDYILTILSRQAEIPSILRILIKFSSRKKFPQVASYLRTNKTVVGQPDCDLKYVEVLAILEFAIFLAEKPSQHLPSFHAGAHDASRFVPMSTTFTATAVLLVTLDHLQTDLVEYANQKLVDIVIDAHRHFDELRAVGACQAFPICNAQPRNSGWRITIGVEKFLNYYCLSPLLLYYDKNTIVENLKRNSVFRNRRDEIL